MPMYEYKCDVCGHSFERYTAGGGAQEDGELCAKCGKGRTRKVFSTFASSSCCGTGSVSLASSGGCGGGNSSFS